MLDWGAAALFLMLAMHSGPNKAGEMVFAQVVIREQIIIRIPAGAREVAPAVSPVEWQERRGPKCVAASSIAGATLLSRNSVDLIMRDNSRIRARLDSRCAALDYYYGFYMDHNADGQICADRDIIRSRVGGQCAIEAFRTLQAVARP